MTAGATGSRSGPSGPSSPTRRYDLAHARVVAVAGEGLVNAVGHDRRGGPRGFDDGPGRGGVRGKYADRERRVVSAMRPGAPLRPGVRHRGRERGRGQYDK